MKPSRILLLVSSAWSIGSGLRFLLMTDADIYKINMFDRFFDWGLMFVFGTLVIIYVIQDYLKEKKVLTCGKK